MQEINLFVNFEDVKKSSIVDEIKNGRKAVEELGLNTFKQISNFYDNITLNSMNREVLNDKDKKVEMIVRSAVSLLNDNYYLKLFINLESCKREIPIGNEAYFENALASCSIIYEQRLSQKQERTKQAVLNLGYRKSKIAQFAEKYLDAAKFQLISLPENHFFVTPNLPLIQIVEVNNMIENISNIVKNKKVNVEK